MENFKFRYKTILMIFFLHTFNFSFLNFIYKNMDKNLRPAIVRMHQQGVPMIEIANLLGICRQTVFKTLKRFGETENNENRPGSGRKRTVTKIKRR